MVTLDALTALQQLRATFNGLAGGTLSAGDSTGSTGSTDFDSLIAALSATNSASGATPTAAANSTTGVSGSLVSDGTVTGADVVADAEKYLGVPYVLGGESTSGMDCSGLVQKTFADLGVSVTRLVHTQKLQGQTVDGLANAKPGDLIVFKGGGHIGIYAGNGMVIHAPYPGRTVSLQKLWVGDSGIETIRRIVPSGDGSDSASGTDATTGTSSSSSSTEPTLAQAQAALVAAQQAVMQADLAMMSGSTDQGSGTGSTTSTDSSSSITDLMNQLATQGAAA
jgi:cell wall-associated NlpC family hydrolase